MCEAQIWHIHQKLFHLHLSAILEFNMQDRICFDKAPWYGDNTKRKAGRPGGWRAMLPNEKHDEFSGGWWAAQMTWPFLRNWELTWNGPVAMADENML